MPRPEVYWTGLHLCDRYLSHTSVRDEPFVTDHSFRDLGSRLAGSMAVDLMRVYSSQGSQGAESRREGPVLKVYLSRACPQLPAYYNYTLSPLISPLQ